MGQDFLDMLVLPGFKEEIVERVEVHVSRGGSCRQKGRPLPSEIKFCCCCCLPCNHCSNWTWY